MLVIAAGNGLTEKGERNMNVCLTHRGEVIMMLSELYKALPQNPEVKQLMEENKITHLINVCPSSVEFVLKEAIKELGGVL